MTRPPRPPPRRPERGAPRGPPRHDGPRAPAPGQPQAEELPEPKVRRALSHVGGDVELGGEDLRGRSVLASALSVESDETDTMRHVHGFHSYPARLHPLTASRLVVGLSEVGGRVLDPFCGSGTVVVESRWLGRRALGVDANPLAVELARLKSRGTTPAERDALFAAAERAGAHATARRKARSGPTMRYPDADAAWFDAHVLLELDGIRDGIGQVRDDFVRGALLLVLSSLLVKLSRRTSDTRQEEAPRRLAAGYPTRLFVKKTRELCERLAEYAALVPADAPPARVVEGDARDLRDVAPGSIQLVVTSPPYPGVYDYVDHHALRYRWLGLDPRRFERIEIGARRTYAGLDPAGAADAWEHELGAVLRALARVLAPGGAVVLVLADTALGGRAFRIDESVARVAPRVGLGVAAWVSQVRPHFHAPTAGAFRETPRREHALLLRALPAARHPPEPSSPAAGSAPPGEGRGRRGSGPGVRGSR